MRPVEYWGAKRPRSLRNRNVATVHRLAAPPHPPQGLGPGSAHDPLQHLGAAGGAGRQHRDRPPAPRPPARSGGGGRHAVHFHGWPDGFPAHGLHWLRCTGRRACRRHGAAPGTGAGAAAGRGLRATDRPPCPALQPAGPARHATERGVAASHRRLFPYPVARPAGSAGQLCAGRLVPWHTERSSATGDTADHQPAEHRPQPVVRTRPELGRAGFGTGLGGRRMVRCVARPGPDPASPSCLPRADRLGCAQALAGVAAIAGGEPRHLPAQPGVAAGVPADHRAGRTTGRSHGGGQRPAAQRAAAHRLRPRWPGACRRGTVRARHWCAGPGYLTPLAGGGLWVVVDHQPGVCRLVPAGRAPVHRPADQYR